VEATIYSLALQGRFILAMGAAHRKRIPTLLSPEWAQ